MLIESYGVLVVWIASSPVAFQEVVVKACKHSRNVLATVTDYNLLRKLLNKCLNAYDLQ